MVLLKAENLSVAYYRDINILKGVSVEVAEQSITSIIGPNGAGKSTLLKALYGLLRPTGGAIYFRGQQISHLRVHDFIRQGIAYVPQFRSLFPDLTVQENLELGTWIFKRDRKRVRSAIARVFERFPILAEKRRQAAGLLSGGQQRILEIGRCLLTDPDVCLLDEPTATLAPKIANQIYATLLDLKSEGVTFVIVDQRVKQAFEISDAIYVLELGENKISGSKEEFEGGLKELIKGWLE
ncbi:MAG: ABC transporter ATP-binding protein [Deltaproteobacteria bacterium]|nr:ABC transporter ATP-binding protein [Deltaproteobacteria bacterium]MBW2069930.1 ABC transporter ATP-binding protein [Deltaproteobacteria bacterium]